MRRHSLTCLPSPDGEDRILQGSVVYGTRGVRSSSPWQGAGWGEGDRRMIALS
jgi:hypothetical protein